MKYVLKYVHLLVWVSAVSVLASGCLPPPDERPPREEEITKKTDTTTVKETRFEDGTPVNAKPATGTTGTRTTESKKTDEPEEVVEERTTTRTKTVELVPR